MRIVEWLDDECNTALVEVGWFRKRRAYVRRSTSFDAHKRWEGWEFRTTNRPFPIHHRLERARRRELQRREDARNTSDEWFPAPKALPSARALPTVSSSPSPSGGPHSTTG